MGKFKIKNFYIFGVMKLKRYFWITILTITANRTTGGHILDGQFQNAKVELDSLSNVEINLPNTAEFSQADLGDGRPAEVNRVER
ncbi:MAG: acetolactate decarboxylase [Nostoc sp.]|uniref:acetolactate decarboxylase n=1 Tax=Nostoc sp. TaxID=1180 RepID=UPI002FFAB2E2